MTDTPKPWERQPGEPRLAFHAFCHYRDLPAPVRSYDSAYTAHRSGCKPRPQDVPGTRWRPTPIWKDWAKTWTWIARCDAHDAELAEQARLKRIGEIDRMNERHANLAVAMQTKAAARLAAMAGTDLSARQVPGWLKEATAIERRARGQATDIVQAQTGPPAVDLSKFTDEELEVYERLLAKAAPEGDA